MQHLDEGTIHAWLDDALTADEAARVQQHASECAECAAMVAEARGLVAGASRILWVLDDVPGVVPGTEGGGRGAAATIASIKTRRRQQRRRFWSRPAVMAAAAGVVLMAGSALVISKGGDRMSVSAPAGDSAVTLSVPTTEAAADARSEVGAASGQTATLRDGAGQVAPANAPTAPSGVSRPRQAAGSSAAGEASRRTAESRAAMPLAGRVAATPPPDTTMRLNEVVVTAVPAPSVAVAKKAAGADENQHRTLAPAPAPAAADRLARQAQPEPSRYSAAAATEPTDTTAVRRRAAARRAASGRAAAARARSEQPVPTTGAEAPQVASRADTVYRVRAETIAVVTRVDTVVVEPPVAPSLRGAGRAGIAARAFPVTGCYEVVEGGLPKFITLTGTRAWSGTAEQRFVATAPGATGYWSQPRSGDVHLLIAGALVTARIDTATGELRGEARRGTSTARFVARRCR